MAKQLRTTLKGYFQTGNIPVEQHYIDFIDSTLNISENNSGNIDLTGNITASGTLSLGGNVSGSGDFITAGITASGHISASGAVTASGINILGNITASGNVKCGNFDVGGSVLFDNISLGGTALTTTFTELNYLDGISSAQGGYVKTMNQSVATTDSPTFAALNIGKVAKGGAGSYGGSIIVPSGGKAFTFTLTSIPSIAGINSGQISKGAPTLIQNASVGSTDVIIINCTNQQLSATAFGQKTATDASTPGFFINLTNDASTDFTAGTAQFTVVVL